MGQRGGQQHAKKRFESHSKALQKGESRAKTRKRSRKKGIPLKQQLIMGIREKRVERRRLHIGRTKENYHEHPQERRSRYSP